MAWTMSSKREGANIRFYIGAIEIATIVLVKQTDKSWRCFLLTANTKLEWFDTVAHAMKRMHELLNRPPPEEI